MERQPPALKRPRKIFESVQTLYKRVCSLRLVWSIEQINHSLARAERQELLVGDNLIKSIQGTEGFELWQSATERHPDRKVEIFVSRGDMGYEPPHISARCTEYFHQPNLEEPIVRNYSISHSSTENTFSIQEVREVLQDAKAIAASR